jgi:hypothetical protein
MTKCVKCFVVFVTVAVNVSALWAAEQTTVNEPCPAPLNLKEPAPWLSLSGDFRFRMVYESARKLDSKASDDERFSTRYRFRLSATVKQSQDASFNVRLDGEPRYYHSPESMEDQFIYEEVLWGRMNYSVKNALDLPLTMTIGRQGISLGSSWLVLDGTPLDGSRTDYFDAIRLTYSLKDIDTTADIIWIENHGDSAKWLKPLNDHNTDLCEQDESGAIIYLSRKTSEKSRLDGYFIYKHDTNRLTSKGSEGEIYTVGAMAEGWLDDNWKYRLEAAPQFGHKNGKSLDAFGGQAQLTWDLKDAGKNRLCWMYEYLSGDDDSDKYFDRVWGRVDTWSALYQGNIDTIDGRAYDNSNLHRLGMSWTTVPVEKIELQTSGHLLLADENTSKGGTGGMSRSGIVRGELLRVQAKYTVCKSVCHVIEGELFFPGDFYDDSRNDVAVLARYGLVLTW